MDCFRAEAFLLLLFIQMWGGVGLGVGGSSCTWAAPALVGLLAGAATEPSERGGAVGLFLRAGHICHLVAVKILDKGPFQEDE